VGDSFELRVLNLLTPATPFLSENTEMLSDDWFVGSSKFVHFRKKMGQRIACLWRRSVELEGHTVIRVGRKIAEGGFSYVFIAREQGGKVRALKRVRIQSKEQRVQAEHELNVHKELTNCKNENIVPLLDVGFFTIGGIDELLLLYPFRERSLRDEINQRVIEGTMRPWTASQLFDISRGIFNGLNELHSHDPCWSHRDLKPENIMMTDDGIPQLMDFGSVAPAVVTIRNRKEALLLQETAAEYSTISYRAPELFDVPSSIDIDGRTDVWSFGCLCFAMLFGYSPFECEFSGGQARVVECTYLRVIGKLPQPPKSMKYSKPFYDMLLECLHVDSAERPTMDDLKLLIQQK
jgi:serine/threonine kinase 16